MLVAATGPPNGPIPTALTYVPTVKADVDGLMLVELVYVTGTMPCEPPLFTVIEFGPVDEMYPCTRVPADVELTSMG